MKPVHIRAEKQKRTCVPDKEHLEDWPDRLHERRDAPGPGGAARAFIRAEARPRRFEFEGSGTRSADAPRAAVGETRSRTDDAAEIPRRVVHRGELAALLPE